MIITDGVHMVSTESENELHAFAARMGLKRRWYQRHPRHPHYDLTTQRAKARAIAHGAVMVKSTEIIERAWWASDCQRALRLAQKPEESAK